MMDIYNMSSLYLVMALTSFFLSRKKTLMMIMSLELILLFMFLNMLMILKVKYMFISPSFYMLVLGACEASMVLSILIIMTRFKGNDMLTKSKMKF